LCLALCFLTKVTFFVPAAVVVFAGTIVWPRESTMRVDGVVSMLVAAATSIGSFWWMDGSIVGYYRFLQSLPFKVQPILLSLRYLHNTRTLGVFGLAMLLVGWLAYDVGLAKQFRREWLLSLMMLGTFVVAASIASQDLEILPMLGIVPLGIIVMIARQVFQRGGRVNLQLAVPAVFASLLLIAHTPKNSVLSWAFSHSSVPSYAGPVARYSAAEIDALNIPLAPSVDKSLMTMMPTTWVDQQAAAIRLLNRPDVSREDVVYAATLSSSISLLTNHPAAVGQLAWWPEVHLSEPKKFVLLHDNLLEDTEWLLRDKAGSYAWQYLSYHRGKYIDENFKLVDENEHWQLYGRKK
jgi:hypothetical protein